MARYYVVEVPDAYGQPDQDSDRREIQYWVRENVHEHANVTSAEYIGSEDVITKIQDGWTGPAYVEVKG